MEENQFNKLFKEELSNVDKSGNTSIGNALFYALFHELTIAYQGSIRHIRFGKETTYTYRHYDYEKISDLFNLLELLATHLGDNDKLSRISDLQNKFSKYHHNLNKKRREVQQRAIDKYQADKVNQHSN